MRMVLMTLFLISPILISAQVGGTVVAPNTDALLVKESAEDKARFLERMKVALEQSKLLLEAKEKLEKVSSAVKQSIQVKRLTEHQQECFELIQWVVKDIDENDYANVVVENSAEEIADLSIQLEQNISSSTKILSSNFFNMKDSERLKFIRELNEEVTEIENSLYRLKRKNRRYNDLYRYYNELAKKQD